jgi:dolichol-phosphate mannosyltransferase/undecaprenyl-phosphate 4-deoxy-4-formamido-L-arabinose transferase
VKISVVIPVYNSSESLKQLCEQFEIYKQGKTYEIHEVIFVNDCSPNPQTWPTLQQLAEKYKWVKALRFTRNFGQQAATYCGLANATGDYILTMDDDMQHHPKNIASFAELGEHDVVIGKITERKSSFLDKLTTNMKSYFDFQVLGKPKHISLSSFRLIRKEIVDEILRIKNVKPFISASIFHITRDVVNVAFEHQARSEGKSNYTFSKRIKLFTLIIIDNSSLLINMLRRIALLTFVISLAYILILLFRKAVLGHGMLGWTSTISAIVLFGSLNLLGISIIGEYLIRIFPIIENRQTYVVKDKLNL